MFSVARWVAALFAAWSICPTALAAGETAKSPDPMADVYVFGLGLGLGVGGAISWKYKETYTGHFTTLNEGWFASDTYAGGADKLGHFFTDYLLVRTVREVYVTHGYDESTSIKRALVASMAIRTVMEVADGYTTFKFSPQDLAANMAGALTSALLLSYPEIDDAFGMSWTYLPSQEKLDGEVDWVSIDNDYNGSIYHLDARLKGVRRLMGSDGDSALDSYMLGLSYETRGYDRVREYKQRIVGLTLSLNTAEILARHTDADSAMRKTTPFFKYFKLPFTFGGLTYDLDHQRYGVRFGLNYFY